MPCTNVMHNELNCTLAVLAVPEYCKECLLDLNIIMALEKLQTAVLDVSQYWDHTGTNMIDGYPLSLPSWDDFLAEVQLWLAKQRELRLAGPKVAGKK